MEMDIFENVDYTGYSFVENEEESSWQINVVCTLAGRDLPTEDAASSEVDGEVS